MFRKSVHHDGHLCMSARVWSVRSHHLRLLSYIIIIMSVSVVSMVSWCGVSWCYVYVSYGDVLEMFCVYFEKLYFCFVCVDDLWRLDVCECCV